MDSFQQKKFYQNLNEVSFYFFVIIALIHIISGLCLSNEIYLKTAWLINRLFDIPFFLVSLVYGISFVKLILIKNKLESHLFDLISFSLGGLLSLTLIIYDLVIPNQLPF